MTDWKLGGEHVEQQLGVGVGVHVAAVDVEEVSAQLAHVREVAVVDEHDPVRRVHVERLALLLGARLPGGRVPDVTDAHGAEQPAHVARAVGLADLALRADEVEDAALGGGDPGGVLAPVLKETEAVVDELSHRLVRDGAHDAAHVLVCSKEWEVRDGPFSHGSFATTKPTARIAGS